MLCMYCIHVLYAMFPLSCACVRAHTGREMSAHKKTWDGHKSSFKKCFFAHLTYMSFDMSAGKMLHTGNVLHTKTLKNLREP